MITMELKEVSRMMLEMSQWSKVLEEKDLINKKIRSRIYQSLKITPRRLVNLLNSQRQRRVMLISRLG